MCSTSELVGLLIYKLLRVMIHVGTVSLKLHSVCGEDTCCGSRFQRVKVLLYPLESTIFHCI